MALPNIGAMRAVADKLDGLGLEYAFVGGFTLSNPDLDEEVKGFMTHAEESARLWEEKKAEFERAGFRIIAPVKFVSTEVGTKKNKRQVRTPLSKAEPK